MKMELPQHIAIILDGNGRWAKAKGMPRSYGHLVGSRNLERMCNVIVHMGIKYLTVYAFSTENWKRAEEEVRLLMNIFRKYLKRCLVSAHKNSMRVRIIGDVSGLAQDLQDQIANLEKQTEQYDSCFLQIALNYGGRDEILRAVSRISEEVKEGMLGTDKLSEAEFASYLDTAGIPDPDLLIRTSGEQRLSNYLLWQLAYSEMYFTETAWPEFHKADLIKAIEYYNTRERRFGGVKNT